MNNMDAGRKAPQGEIEGSSRAGRRKKKCSGKREFSKCYTSQLHLQTNNPVKGGGKNYGMKASMVKVLSISKSEKGKDAPIALLFAHLLEN
jgi:hypothetical protein